MYFIRKLNDNGVSEIYCKTSGTKGLVYFFDFPYKMEGYKSYDRAFKRLVQIKEKYPEYNLDILHFDVD